MFPGATTDPAEADYAILGAPLDATTSFQPGTRFGPDRIRTYGQQFEDYDQDTDLHFTDCNVADCGDIHPWDDVSEYLDFLEGELADHVAADRVPIMLGGEHSVTTAGVRAVEPEVVVSLDAHLDLRDSFEGTQYSHACMLRRALAVADEAIVLGARSGAKEEWERASESDVTVVPPADIPSWTPPSTEDLYLTVDVDVVDPAFAPGTGTPEPGGIDSRTCRELVRELAPRAQGFDVVEVNDRDDGQAPALGAKVVRDFVFGRVG